MEKEFSKPTANNQAILDSVSLDSLNCHNMEALKAMSNSARDALEAGMYSFYMEFDLETTGDASCDKKLGLKGDKKNKGK